MLIAAMAVLAFGLGALMPLRWGIVGFVGAAILVFLVQAGVNTASGFAGSSLEESLLLFNGSYASYVGFNLQITYRAFALPLLALAVPLVFRFSRSLRRD